MIVRILWLTILAAAVVLGYLEPPTHLPTCTLFQVNPTCYNLSKDIHD